MKKAEFKGNWKEGSNVKMHLPVMVFEEDDTQHCIYPSFGLKWLWQK